MEFYGCFYLNELAELSRLFQLWREGRVKELSDGIVSLKIGKVQSPVQFILLYMKYS